MPSEWLRKSELRRKGPFVPTRIVLIHDTKLDRYVVAEELVNQDGEGFCWEHETIYPGHQRDEALECYEHRSRGYGE